MPQMLAVSCQRSHAGIPDLLKLFKNRDLYGVFPAVVFQDKGLSETDSLTGTEINVRLSRGDVKTLFHLKISQRNSGNIRNIPGGIYPGALELVKKGINFGFPHKTLPGSLISG
jgi:hypothetical protein